MCIPSPSISRYLLQRSIHTVHKESHARIFNSNISNHTQKNKMTKLIRKWPNKMCDCHRVKDYTAAKLNEADAYNM